MHTSFRNAGSRDAVENESNAARETSDPLCTPVEIEAMTTPESQSLQGVAAFSTPIVKLPFRRLWGGIVQSILEIAPNDVWTAEDGGRMRHFDGSVWSEFATPDAVRTTLNRIFFRTSGTGAQIGWAVSAGGQLLRYDSSTKRWSIVATLGDPTSPGTPAILWDIFFVDDTFGWVVGVHLIKYTDDGGSTWKDVVVQTSNGINYNPSLTEVYRIAFVRRGAQFVALAVGEPGLVFRATSISQWTAVFDIKQLAGMPSCFTNGNLSPVEPWDVSFVPGSTPAQSIAFLVGARGNGCGYVLKSIDSGLSWTPETFSSSGNPQTPYTSFQAVFGLTTFSGGGATSAGYGGQILQRDPVSGVWQDVTQKSPGALPVLGSQPFHGASGDGASQVRIAGLFGEVRRNDSAGALGAWNVELGAQQTWRLRDIEFVTPSLGWIVGQFFRIARSTDGGNNWVEQFSTQSASSLAAIALADEDAGVAVGDAGTILWTDTGSAATSQWSAPTSNPASGVRLLDVCFIGLAPSGRAAFWAIGLSSIYRSDDGGQNWHVVNLQGLPASSSFFSTAADGTGRVYLVGQSSSGALAVRVADPLGANPIAENLLVASVAGVLSGVSADATHAYAVGAAGLVMHLDLVSQQFVFDAVPTTVDLSAVSIVPGSNPPNVIAGGSFGVVLHHDLNGWSSPRSSTSEDIQACSFLTVHDGWIVGSGKGTIQTGDSIILRYQL